MATLNIPLLEGEFYSQNDVPALQIKLQGIGRLYEAEIEQVSKLTKVPENLIKSFIYIESGGNANIANASGATGLMQLKADTVVDMLFLENKKGRLSISEKKILESIVGKTELASILNMRWMGDKDKLPKNPITSKMLKKPLFSILVGSIYLGILIDQCTENNVIRLDKVVLRYNRGYFFKVKGSSPNEVLTQNKNNKEAYTYLLKLGGKNGIMDILTT